MKRETYVYLLFFTFSLSTFAYGNNIHFRTVGSLQGLSQSSAISIWQDKIGRMWIGNDALNCYDGTSSKVYRISEYYPEIEDADIHNICGTESHIFFMAGNNLIEFDITKETFQHTEIKAQYITVIDDILYYSTLDGELFNYDPYSYKKTLLYTIPSKEIIITHILQEEGNVFWLGTTNGLYKVDIASKEILSLFFETDFIYSLFRDSFENIWISCRGNQVQILQPNEQIIPLLNSENKPPKGEVLCFTEDSKGIVWIGSYMGVYTAQPPIRDKRAGILQESIIPEASIFALHTDQQGTIWIGSYYGDVRYFNPETDNYTLYIGKEREVGFLHGMVLGDIVEDNEGNLYVASEGSGVNIIKNNRSDISQIISRDGSNNKIRSLFYDKEYNRLYIGSYMQGLSFIERYTEKQTKIETDIFTSRYQRIIEDIILYENYLILSTQDGLFKMDRKTLEVTLLFAEQELQDLCRGITRTIYLDDRNVLWVSSLNNGLFTIDMNTRRVLEFYGDGLKDKKIIPSAVISICGDSKHGLYFATLKSGILSYNMENNTFRNYTTEGDLLLSDICYNVELSRYGNLVVTSNKGVSILNISVRREIDSSSHIRLDGNSPIMSISPDCGLYISPRDGLIFVGGLQRLISFDERDITMAKRNYSLYFSSLLVNNVPINSPSEILPQSLQTVQQIVLPANKNTISITFSSSNYISPYYTRYEYRLKGLDDLKEWTKTDYKTITYTALPAGEYTLEVRETTDPDKTTSIKVIILPTFWQSKLAYLLYCVLVLIIVILLVKEQNKKMTMADELYEEKRKSKLLDEESKNKLDFFEGIANEFRTPLTLIIATLDGLANDFNSVTKSKIDKIKKHTIHLQLLFKELQDFRYAKNGLLKLNVRHYSITNFLQEVYETALDFDSDGQISFRYYHTDEDIKAWFDMEQMQKVLYNLILIAYRSVLTKGTINLSLNNNTDNIEIQINCIGKSFNEELFEQILELLNNEQDFFSQSKNNHGLFDNGIGIAFSKRIINMHKGSLEVKREEGQISIIINLKTGDKHFSEEEKEGTYKKQEMKLPTLFSKIQGEEKERLNVESPEEESTKRRFRILVVDRDKDIKTILKDAFSSIYEVYEANSAEEAMKIALTKQPEIIISEVSLIGQSGLELCHMLKANIETLHIPILLMTTYPSTKQQNESIRAGADDYIVKPFNLEYLFLRCNSIVKYRSSILQKYKGKLIDDIPEMATNNYDQEFLDKAVQILENNLINPDFDVYMWSKELGIGRTRLFDRVKQVTGMTPNDYILSVKINKAMKLLREREDLTISEIAYQFGFSNPAYFTKCFKRQVGVPPQQYRRKEG